MEKVHEDSVYKNFDDDDYGQAEMFEDESCPEYGDYLIEGKCSSPYRHFGGQFEI